MSTVTQVKNQVSKSEVKTVQDFFIEKRDLIARALPNTITPDRLIGVFTMILKSSPQLTQCSQSSLVAAVIQAVQLGLTPGNIGHFHLIPFNNKGKMEAQFMIGFKGLMELVNRSGNACILGSECVYSKDQFEYEQGLTPKLRHVPADGERGEFIGVYCVAKNMLANEKVFVYLQKEEVEKVKASSKAASSEYSPWAKWPAEMAKKTAVKRICKMLPLSVEMQQKVSTDETIKTQIDKSMVEVPDTANWEAAQEAEVIKENKEEKPDEKSDKNWEFITEDQRRALLALANGKGKSKEHLNAILVEKWAITSTTKIPSFILEDVRDYFNKMVDVPEA